MPQRARSAEEVKAAQDAKLEKLSQVIEQRVERLVTGENWLAAVAFAARFRSRSFLNCLAIEAQHADAFRTGRVSAPVPTYVAGYTDWKALGRWPTQPGYLIRAPAHARFASADPASPSWRRLHRREKPKPGEVVRREFVGVRPAYVWDVSQTDGRDIPRRPEPVLLAGAAPAGLWEGLAAEVERERYTLVTVRGAAVIHGANGLTDFGARIVSVRGDMDPAARVRTLAHELGHVHLDDPGSPDAGAHRGVAEVRAESVAAMVCTAFGMDPTAYTVPYVAGWADAVPDSSPVEVIRAVGERARQVTLDLLSRLPEPPVGDGNPPPPETPVVAPKRGHARTVSATARTEGVGL